MVSRRQFLKCGATGSVGLGLLGALHREASAQAPALLDPRTVPQFVNPLPVPRDLNLRVDAKSGGPFVVEMGTAVQSLLGPGFPSTPVWGYGVDGGPVTYPGASFEALRDTPVGIQWVNNLPYSHLLPVDTTLHWAFGNSSLSIASNGVPAVAHLHGGHTASEYDGLPDQWFTPDGTKGPGYYSNFTVYDNDQEAGTLWYHDHALGITRLNVYAGLAGFYLLRDSYELALMAQDFIPSGPYEIELAIQDRLFTSDGMLYYPSLYVPAAIPQDTFPGGPSVLPEFFGNVILVNGKAWPILDVEPRQYRFRMLNGSDSRFYNLWINSGAAGNVAGPDGNGPRLTQIGTDAGFLYSPVRLSQLTLGPGERADVVVDFRGWEGQTLIMRNNARSPFPKGATVDPRLDGRIMAFRVGTTSVTDPVTLPAALRPQPFAVGGPVANTRKLVLFEAVDRYGRLQPLLGTIMPGSTNDGTLLWDDEITETPFVGDVEIWEVYNATMDAHPIHLHLVSFEILSRQKYTATILPKENIDPMHPDAAPTLGGILTNVRLKGRPMPPEPNELGPKDTALMYPGEVTRIKAKFDRAGLYVWHCHILSHEDHEMMRPMLVIP